MALASLLPLSLFVDFEFICGAAFCTFAAKYFIYHSRVRIHLKIQSKGVWLLGDAVSNTTGTRVGVNGKHEAENVTN
jgi:hypothetical protein